jgi:hypothetical protein
MSQVALSIDSFAIATAAPEFHPTHPSKMSDLYITAGLF